MRPCPNPSASIYHADRKVAFGAPCGNWGCRPCGSRKRDKLARRGASLHVDGILTTTISDRSSGGLDASGPEALAYLQERERVFRRHVQRLLGFFIYLWVVEFGEENGRVHRHYLWRWKNRKLVAGFRRGWLPKHVLRLLQECAKSAGLGRIDWSPVRDDRGAASYVAKYVAKTLGTEEFPTRTRRFSSNEHYEEPKEAGWQFANLPADVVLRALNRIDEPVPSREYWLLPEEYLPHAPPPIPSPPRPSIQLRLSW